MRSAKLPSMKRRGRFREKCGWKLLRDAADYDRFNRLTGGCYTHPPQEYPCLVREEFTADQETEYSYLYAACLCDMMKLIITRR